MGLSFGILLSDFCSFSFSSGLNLEAPLDKFANATLFLALVVWLILCYLGTQVDRHPCLACEFGAKSTESLLPALAR